MPDKEKIRADDAGPPQPCSSPSRPAPSPSGPPADWFILLDRINEEVRRLHWNRTQWKEFPHPEDWVGELYYGAQLLGIRRMVDGDRRAGSFKRLLHKMTEDAPLLTRAWLLANAPAELAAEAGADFTRQADPAELGHLNPAVPRADLRNLASVSERIKRYVDQHVTHAQLEPDADVPTAGDVEAALDTLSMLLAKYSLILNRR